MLTLLRQRLSLAEQRYVGNPGVEGERELLRLTSLCDFYERRAK